MGIASLVLGIISFCMGFIPVIGIIFIIAAIVGLILGIADVVKKGKTGGKKGPGIAGIVICAIAIISILITSFIIGLGLFVYFNADDVIQNTSLENKLYNSNYYDYDDYYDYYYNYDYQNL